MKTSTSTPWGTAQSSIQFCHGIIKYGTESHGGVHLSPVRNMAIPEYMRNTNGWYEEDCEWAIPAVVFPEAWIKHSASEDIIRTAKKTLLEYYPEYYETFYNVVIKEGESSERDKQNFFTNNINNYIVICAIGREHIVEVIATLGGTVNGKERTFLIKKEEYRNRSDFGFIIDLGRHIEI